MHPYSVAMRTIVSFISAITVIGLLVACGKTPAPGQQPESGLLEISVPHSGQNFAAGVVITASGTVPDGASAMVSIDGSTPVAAVMADAAHEGRRLWTAELSGLPAGAHTISITAEVAGEVLQSEVVPFHVVAAEDVEPAGQWDGAFVLYDRNDEVSVEGTMQVFYGTKSFRMRFDVNEITGTTDGWDLIDSNDFRMTGTYIPAGGTNRLGEVIDREKVEYHGVAENGAYSMRGGVWRDN